MRATDPEDKERNPSPQQTDQIKTMITAHYINEGATLVLNSGGNPHYIHVTDETRSFCESAFKSQNDGVALLHDSEDVIRAAEDCGYGIASSGRADRNDKEIVKEWKQRRDKIISGLREDLADLYIKESGKEVHSSDCSTSVAPAENPGPCDCNEDSEGPSESTMQELATQYKFFENERYRKDMTDAGRGHLLR